MNRCVACLREIVPYAAERGVVVALENHGGITTTAEQVLRLVRMVDHPWLGINLDFGNFRVDPYREIEQVAPWAVTTHAKVSSRFGEQRAEVDYVRVVRIMRTVGYEGYLSVEFEEKEDPRVGVPRFVARLREALASA